ncbi:vacuolar protein sorting-associated protein 13 isoform X1 [Diprion similis]|uniref:vacuolar protein sorting-associated protein 13 isoform X1 n=1 Tax=Diprion similis TaxID=362088 RepID=UPI001EF8FB37|nr:vacuolar protein sorting-associated protein 13 isoform X1 [Diprion similis]
MVFESVVAELLNKVLGDYIENLDHKQLKLSLWGGDVVLKDLLIKESALDKLDQPIKLAYGRLGKLILKIPFKDMWNGQVDAIIEELYLLVVPGSQTQYDAEKEAKTTLEAKQAEIARVEQTKREAEVKGPEKLDDSMVEKLVARMIKNIHVEIKKIHVRYEDHMSFKDAPFAVGFTLNNFTVESCNESWTTSGNLKDMHAIAQIYKLCTLDGLGVYLNPTSEQISNQLQYSERYTELFIQGIATTDHKPLGYQYLLGPINAKVKLKLNPKPETDGSNYTIPKVWMDAEMQKLKIGLTKLQYQTIMRLGEGLDRAQKAAPYRKYRPNLTSYRGHYKEWWKFAYTCILEETIRRSKRNWDWSHMKQHRDTCRIYAKAYHAKLTNKKIAQNIIDQLTECEKTLDIFNLVIIRQQIELEVERLAEKEKNLKAKRGWFGFLWGSGQTEEEQDLTSAAAIMRKFEEAMTPQEKEKLYRAIDYQENSGLTHYPETYEDIDCRFFLHGLEVFVLDTEKEFPQVLDLQFNGVQVGFKSRPSGNGMTATASINNLKLLGVRQQETVPVLLSSEEENSDSMLFAVTYEKNPIDKLCGDRVIIKSTSVQVVYDAHTIIELVSVFKVQDNSTLSQIQAAAAMQLEGLKEMSALGLEYAIEKHSILDIQVDLQASQLIVPHKGFYTGNESLFVLNLGSLKVNSLAKPRDSEAPATVKQLVGMGKSEEDILAQLRTYSYDKFIMKIVNFQALVCLPNENWRETLSTGVVGCMTVLKPTTLEIQLDKCLILDDPLLPKMRILGQLPSVALNISDSRLLEAITIAHSIPLPQNEDVPVPQPLSTKSASQLSLKKELSAIPSMIEKKQSKVALKQTTDLEAKFVMKEFVVTLMQQEGSADSETQQPFLKVEVLKLEAEMVQRSFDQDVKLRLGGIQVTQYHDKGEIYMINTPMASGIEEYLIIIQYVTVNKHSPEFTTVHGSVLQLLQMDFTKLDVLLHQEAIINVLKFISNVQGRISATTEQTIETEAVISTPNRFATIHEEGPHLINVGKQKILKATTQRKKRIVVECIDLKIQARVGLIGIKMASDAVDIGTFLIKNVVAGYIVKTSYSQANVNIGSIQIADHSPTSIYENIISVTSSESLQVQAVIYNVEPWEVDKNNMSIKVVMGCHRVVFLNSFVTRVMNFLNHFQAAQEAIKEASAAAAEAAKTNIQDVQEGATRIELGIKIKAPVVYIPMNSKSEHALMLDMGNLTVTNTLKKLEVISEDGNSPVVDEMKIDLQDIKLSRVKLNKNEFVADNEVLLLHPLSFTFLIKRNLSTAWFTAIPDIDMSGRLKKIELSVSQADYGTIMKVLNENLGETVDNPEPDIAQSSKAPPAVEWNRQQSIKPDLEVTRQSVVTKPQEQKQIHTLVKFEFIMDSLVINLFSGGSKLLASDTSPLHLAENGLAKFSLSHFAVKGRMFGDGLLATSVLLMNCTLDDTRLNREGSLTRIMERIDQPLQSDESSPEKEAKPIRSMVDMTLRKGINDTFVDVRVFSFSIIVSLDYLMKVKDFFNVEQPPPAQIPPTVVQKGVNEVNSKKNKSSINVQPIAAMFTLNLHIEKPDIILLEDMDNIDSNCIILNTEVFLKLRMVGDHQTISGSIKDMSILTGIYNPPRRSDSIYQVLRPCSISLAGSTPEGKGLHVDICCTDIHVSVSPGVIEILNKVVQTVTKTQDDNEDLVKSEPNYSGVWTITPFRENDYWFLKAETGVEAFEDLAANEGSETDCGYKHELAVVSAPTILLTLEAGVGNKTLPMLLFYLGFQSNVNDWSTRTMSIECTMTLAVAYYNSCLALWEPLIEPMESRKHGKRFSSPWELNTKIQFHDLTIDSPPASLASPSSEADPEVSQQSAKMSIDVSSTENLELTVTKTCLDVLKQLGNAFSNAIEPGKMQVVKMAPYLLKNETGLSMTLHLEHGYFKVIDDPLAATNSSTGSYMEVVLESGASVELAPTVVKSAKTHILDDLKAESVKIQSDNTFVVSFKGIENKLEVPVLRADKRYFSLKHRGDGADEWGIISDVVVEGGSTIITLRSVLQVHNHFSEPISVYYMTKRGNEVECVGTVEPDQCLNLPIDAVYTPTNELFFSVEGYTVSIIPFIWKDLQKTVSMTKLLQCEPRSRQEYVEPFYIKMFFMMIMVGSILYNNNTLGLLLDVIDWHNILNRSISYVEHRCSSLNKSEVPKYLEGPIQAVGEIEQVYLENTSRHTMSSTSYNIHLYPSVYLKNFLPIDIVISLPGIMDEKLVEASKILQIPTIEPGRSSIVIKLPQYLEKDWSCRVEIQANPPEFSVCSFESYDSPQKVVMDLGIHTSFKHGSLIMALYCPFWMLNKTGLMLYYRKSSKSAGKDHSSPTKKWISSLKPHPRRGEYGKRKGKSSSEDNLNVLYHPETYKGIILFSFSKKAFFGKKKAMIRVEEGEWSDKFSIDVAGSKGVVSCKYKGVVYQIGVHNQLTYNSLTKQITFTPYYVLINNSDFFIECQESERPADPLFKIPPGECTAFWPRSEHEVKTLKAKVVGHPETTAAFIYTDVHTTLLKLENKYGGINVDVQINEGGIYISMSGYTPGNAPALIINHTSHTINLWEKGSMNVRSIQSYNRMFYTWENPAGSRTLVWEDGNKKEIENDLRQDKLGPFTLPEVEQEVFYVSFLDGIQRVLLFTANLKIAEDCELAGALEANDQEITLNIHGVGLSLVNNISRTELLYMCIASSGVIWETRKSLGSQWRALSTKDVIAIEDGYQNYLRELQIGRDPPYRVMLEPKLEVDYLNMQMMKPHRRYIHRTFQTGLWMQYRSSVHQVQLHAKINRLQIDNQLSDCVFPVILAPVPPPKSVVHSSVMKPFAELSILKRLLEHSTVQQFKYFKVLIQEFHIKVDIGFIGAITDLFKDDEASDAEESGLFQQDMKLVTEPLMYHVSQITTAEQKNFFDLLHFSPLKIHISFSMTGSSTQLPQVLNVLLQGIGVTLTDINDIVFKLAYFERQFTFMTHNQLTAEATNHYVGQAIKQAYVLVLGLDVIGNPYGLVVGTMKGIEDLFYEPFQGAIQGPGEFAEGLMLGVRSMFGHTVGGMAGAVSKITGAMGKGIAALTFDKDYQRKRQEQLNKQPANLQEGLARSGKGLVMGVFDGVTGVVMKPISGAKEEGVEGFFKGFGKGVVGLVTRPTAGVIDFASGSFGAVKRATEMGEEVKRVRPPRFLQLDSLVRPYIRHEADGNKILLELEKGKYANTDIYVYHVNVNKDVVLLTDKRIAFLVHNDLFGGWQVEWSYTWPEVGNTPKVVERGVEVPVKESHKKKKLGNFFSGTDHGKIILVSDPETRQVLCSKIEEQVKLVSP